MKTKHLILVLVLFGSILLINAQTAVKFEIPTYKTESVIDNIQADLLNEMNLDNFSEDLIPELELDYNTQVTAETIQFMRMMLALGAGIGFGESQTLWCLQAAFYYQLMAFSRSAMYVSLGGLYEGANYDSYKNSFFDIQLQVLMFTVISRLAEIRLLYGPRFGYGFGNDKFDSNKQKFTRFSASLVVGFQLMIAMQWSIALQTSLFAYQNTKFKDNDEYYGGSDYNTTFGFINKNNILALSIFFHLGGGNAR